MRRHLGALSVFVIAACVQVHQVVLRGDLPDHYDYWLQQFVHLALLRRALLGGELPLWNPFLAGGTPHLADPQAAVLYPLTALPLLVLAPEHVARLVIPLHIVIAGAGTYALAHSFGASRAAALSAGLGYMLAPHFAPIELQTYFQQSASWVPWVMWSLHRGVVRPSHWWFTLAGALYALQLASGSPQFWYFTGLFVGAFALILTARERRAAGGIALAGCVSLGLSAAQLFPSIELLTVSHRNDAFSLAEASGRGQVSFLNLLGHAGPDAEVSGAYPGALLLLLGLAGALLVARGLALFFAGSAIVGLALCLGSATPLWELAYRLIPGFALWHMPHRALFVWSLSISVLAALGVDALRPRWPGLSGWVPLMLALLVATELLAHTLPRLSDRFYSPSTIYALPDAAAWLTSRAAETGPVRFASATYGPPLNRLGELKAPDNRRLAYLPPNVSAIYPGLDAFQGYLAIRLERTGALFNNINDVGDGSRLLTIHDPRSRLVDVYGVRYFVTDEIDPPADRLRPVFAAPGLRIWENPEAFPFAWWSAETSIDAASTPDPRGSVTVLHRSFNSVELEMTSPATGHLVVNQIVSPGWRAFVSGRRAPLGAANGAQQAVHVGRGSQRVMLRYLPFSVVAGAALTGATTAAIVTSWLIRGQRAAARRGAARA